MAHLTRGVEYGVHCLTWLVGSGDKPLSSADLATLQGVPVAFVAKIFQKLERAQIVTATPGVAGGYRLARSPAEITILDVVDAIEGDKPLFDCQEIRGNCALFGGSPPPWATRGVCAIHAVMLAAEKSMRDRLAATSLAEIVATVDGKAPAGFGNDVEQWISARTRGRRPARSQASHGLRQRSQRSVDPDI